ncbi:hypothetical protein D9757_006077 [Collybiopsis confluens]|uniref:Glutamine amidotransferase domain-containing protein n=1 Tax=Collybiopsis confluens TaxID=2823264 RepID=A0A8H5HHY7_9AGAR|nr:hypothetical protein D9757_006077 [Collybiopsis confluens]
MSPPKRTVSVALLVCGPMLPQVVPEHGDQPEIIENFLRKSLKSFANSDETDWRDVDLAVHSYDVVGKMEYPAEQEIDGYGAMLITGSVADAYAQLEWIRILQTFIVHLARDHPGVRLFGICFGHQIISIALGGDCVNNDGKWESGPTKIRLTDVGRRVFGKGHSELVLHEMHQDHVPLVPRGFHLLASTDISMNQGMLALNGDALATFSEPPQHSNIELGISSFSPKDIHILTVQAHPEFTNPIVAKIVDVLVADQILTESFGVDVAKQIELQGPDRIEGDGLVVGRAFWRVLGVGGARKG